MMGELTERGEILAAGGAQLATPDGDDTLTPQDRPADEAASDSASQDERDQAADTDSDAQPGPDTTEQDVNVLPVEQADDSGAAERETR